MDVSNYQRTEEGGLPVEGQGELERLLVIRERVSGLVSDLITAIDTLNSVLPASELRTKRLGLTYQPDAEYLANLVLKELNQYSDKNQSRADRVARNIDCLFWRRAMDDSGLGEFMSASVRDAFDRSLEENELKFDRSRVYQQFESLVGAHQAIFVSSVIDVFDSLAPRFKSNDGISFGDKLIFPSYFSSGTYSQLCHTQVDDLERLIRLIEACPVARNESSATKIREAFNNGLNTYEDRLFSARMFHGNRNLHLSIKSAAALSQMNQILAREKGNCLGHRTRKRA
ncbi:DUF4942 domain-containing protein [uncultured Umboniibacter sp.]|uniref:DUF4942 domain-containing protein n=1 Tax=uncultured Umboniibacter sp. TaxID=1798917 RepID=UPI0026107348|nr:DUF4942 domain-containing protein [uncultured Umboniibacter sp.]